MPYGGSQLVLTLYRIFCFCFQMCNRLPEIKKNGDAGIFPVYYSLKDLNKGEQVDFFNIIQERPTTGVHL